MFRRVCHADNSVRSGCLAGKNAGGLSYMETLIAAAHRVSVVFALQTWLAETPEQKRNTGTPSYFAVGMSSKP
jgi:hypothetical protein